jgi:hypothetical protein
VLEALRSNLLAPDDPDNAESDRNLDLFQRAYYANGGPFEKVVERLKDGFSVLVYLPGNSMSAAAALVRQRIQSRAWTEYGEHLGGEESIINIWQSAGGIIKNWREWLKAESGREPGAIFHNLDFLTDWHGGVYGHPEAQTALACLVGGIRSSVVLGLSDRDAGPLPNAISRAFNEEEWLNEIPAENFRGLLPVLARERLEVNGEVPAGAIWLLASRLRWSDPVRAFRIMQQVVGNHSGLDSILDEILNLTQTVNFLTPGHVYTGGRPRGFEPEKMALLEENIIEPFRQWKIFKGDWDECRRVVRRLPPGLILHGPPGTGKTTLARWIAREINLPVRTVSGSEIRAGLWGDAEKNVRNLFRDARRAAPCVLILDDADDLLPDRNTAQGGVASAERAVVNEFLQQLQGVRGRLEGVLVILTTNRFKELDKAAKERLAMHLRIPYPPDDQLDELVEALAEELGLNIVNVKAGLVARFRRTIAQVKTPDKAVAESNYFSPREMQQAMRLLEGWGDGHQLGQGYTPDENDLTRMEKYYEELGRVLAEAVRGE